MYKTTTTITNIEEKEVQYLPKVIKMSGDLINGSGLVTIQSTGKLENGPEVKLENDIINISIQKIISTPLGLEVFQKLCQLTDMAYSGVFNG